MALLNTITELEFDLDDLDEALILLRAAANDTIAQYLNQDDLISSLKDKVQKAVDIIDNFIQIVEDLNEDENKYEDYFEIDEEQEGEI